KALGDEAFAKYNSWHQREFARLFKQNVDVLSRIQEIEGAQLHFNDKTLQWSLDYRPPRISSVPGMEQEARLFTRSSDINPDLRIYRDSLERLNQGLPILSSVAKAAGWDVKDYLMSVLLELGYDPKNT